MIEVGSPIYTSNMRASVLKKGLTIFFGLFFLPLVYAGESYVPLKRGIQLAADDLIYQQKILSSREALLLSQSAGLDLSLLPPKNNEIWSSKTEVIDDQELIQVTNGETLLFKGSLRSISEQYRFNAYSLKQEKIYTVLLDKTLHTLLLRKNILRKLGYKVPPIKYLKKLTIKFETKSRLEAFIKDDIRENTSRPASRWVKREGELSVDIIDIAVTEPAESDFYNPALGIPNTAFNSRTIRSLLIPYSLLDFLENVNMFSWINGKIDNQAVVLSHFTGKEFSTSIEDALWMIRKVNLLSRLEIESAVDNAYFPPEVGKLVVEKIISRRNSLNKILEINEPELSFDQSISAGEFLCDGVLLKGDFEGYASRFAYGDVETPFAELRYFLYSKLQSNVIDNLIFKFNSNLKAYDLNQSRSEFFKKQFLDGLKLFIDTGELRPIGIGNWSSPVLNAQLIFSRDVVLGNYLGTNNLVQLADTFGASLDLGVHYGYEGLGENLAGSIRTTTSIVRTFSHLKPVKSLKQSLKEPYKNIFVNLLKNSLKEKFFTLSELKNLKDSENDLDNKIQNTLKEISENLDTGESLIVTDLIMPTINFKLNFNTDVLGLGMGVAGQNNILKRVHFFKKSPKILQIYDDRGNVKSLSMNFSVHDLIPILNIKKKIDKGHYNLKSYMVNISSKLSENPNFYANSLGIYNVLKNNDFEILEQEVSPVKAQVEFFDRTFGFSLMFWKMKALKGKTYYHLQAKDGVHGNYFSFNKDFMSGINLESFVTSVLNYYLKEKTSGDFILSENGEINPADSFFGHSKTSSVRYEASIDEQHKFDRRFISLSDKKEGWALSKEKLIYLMEEINQKFGAILFDTHQVDFDKLRMYKVGYQLNLYEKAIGRLSTISIDEIQSIENRYMAERGCQIEDIISMSLKCGSLRPIISDLIKCKKSKTEEDLALCQVELVDDLFTYLNFSDFKKMMGENNFYVFGTSDGFRERSEILNETIYSHTLGKIGGQEWNGPLEVVRELLGLSSGELSGRYLRESL